MRCYVVGVEQIRRCTSFPLFFFFFKRRLITATGRWKRHVYTWLVLLLLPWTIFPSHRDFNKIWSFGYRSISGGFLNWNRFIDIVIDIWMDKLQIEQQHPEFTHEACVHLSARVLRNCWGKSDRITRCSARGIAWNLLRQRRLAPCLCLTLTTVWGRMGGGIGGRILAWMRR